MVTFRIASAALLLAGTSALAAPPPLSVREQAEIRRVVGGKLKDGESARWQWPVPTTQGQTIAYCGFVNAKNSYGGYTGFAQFFVLLTRGAHPSASGVAIGGDDALSTQIVDRLCAASNRAPD